MKVKIFLDKSETLESAEEVLEKALHAKKECSSGEKYSDDVLNDFHDYICKKHEQLLHSVLADIRKEIETDVNLQAHYQSHR
jgi:hypothetical protein